MSSFIILDLLHIFCFAAWLHIHCKWLLYVIYCDCYIYIYNWAGGITTMLIGRACYDVLAIDGHKYTE